MMTDKKNAIVILAGGLKKEKGKWRTTNFQEGDNFGATGDRLRVLAGACLFKSRPQSFIVASGSAVRGQHKNIKGIPHIAEVIKKELIGLGVPGERILTETRSNNTFEQLLEIKKILKRNKYGKIFIVSNEWHLPRIRAFIKYRPELKPLKNNPIIQLKSAEAVMTKSEPVKWKKLISSVYKSRAMRERVKIERKGIKDIKAGKYQYKLYKDK